MCEVPGVCFPPPASFPAAHLPLGTVDVSFYNVVCEGISVGQMELTASKLSDSTVRFVMFRFFPLLFVCS